MRGFGVAVVAIAVVCCSAVAPTAAAALASGKRTTDTAIAEDAVLKAADLPAGWDATGPQPESTTPKSIASCAVVRRSRTTLHRQPHALSPELTNGDETASASVFVFPTVAGARRVVDAYRGDDAVDCVHELGIRAARRVAGVDHAEFEVAREELSEVGDAATVFDGHLTIAGPDGTAESTVQAIVVRVGRAIVGFNFQTAAASPAVAPDAIGAVVSRLERTLRQLRPRPRFS